MGRIARWGILSICILGVGVGVGVYCLTGGYTVPVAHPQRGPRRFGMETFRRDTEGRYPEMMDRSVFEWVARLCIARDYPVLPPVTYSSSQMTPSRGRFFILGDTVSSVLESRLTIILWQRSFWERPDKLEYEVLCDGRRIECQATPVEVVEVPARVREVLARVMTTPPRQVARVHLVCLPGLHEAGEIRINVRRTDGLTDCLDVVILRPRWGKEPFMVPRMPWTERPGEWDAMRKEKYLRSQVDALLAYGGHDSTFYATVVLMHLLSAEVDAALRWKLLGWLEEIDKDKRILSAVGRREIRRILPKDPTSQPVQGEIRIQSNRGFGDSRP